MALAQLNGNVVAHATELAFYEDFFPKVKHINGKGITERYITDKDPKQCKDIDIPRLLPIKPHYRTLGASTNGGWRNVRNADGGYAMDAEYYTVSLNHVYDESTPLPYTLVASSPLDFKAQITRAITDCYAQTINAFTWAKQLYAFFNDNASVSETCFNYDGSTTTASDAFLDANASLSDGLTSIGAFAVPADARQAFVSTQLNKAMKSGYSTNASDLSAQINSTGFLNPFTQAEGKRVDMSTGICGLYDGVVMTLWNKAERKATYEVLGLDETDDATVWGLLDYVQGFVVYGEATLRGMTPLAVQVKDDPNNYGTYIFAPFAKFGVGVLTGESVKLITSTALTDENLTTIKSAIEISDYISAEGDGDTYSSQSHI